MRCVGWCGWGGEEGYLEAAASWILAFRSDQHLIVTEAGTMLREAPLLTPGTHPLLAGDNSHGGEAVALKDGVHSQGIRCLKYVVNVREAHQSLGGVIGAFLHVIGCTRLGVARLVMALLPQQAEVISEVGVEEEVKQRIQAGRQGQDHEEDGFNDLWGDEEEVECGGEGEEGHWAVEQAVGEDQPGHMLDHGTVPDSTELSLQQAAVESDVGACDSQEAEHVCHHQGHSEAQGGEFSIWNGVREAERGCSIFPNGEEWKNSSHRGQQQAAKGSSLDLA